MRSAFRRDVWAVLGMPIDNVTLDEAATLIERAVETRQRLSFVTPNVNWLVRALKDPSAMRQIINADLSLADGAPIVWLARKLGMPLKERVAGSDVFERLRRDTSPDAKPIRVFFFGGRDGAAEAACKVLEDEQGRIKPAGWHNPGFGDLGSMSTSDIRDKINAAKPDFVLVSLGAAKGQSWIEMNEHFLEAPVVAHLGAVVDFVAGTIKRAPGWVSRIGLEWVWRIVAEPSLWKRYWDDGTALLSFINGRMKPLQRAAKVEGSSQPLKMSVKSPRIFAQGDAVLANREVLKTTLERAMIIDEDMELDLSGVNTIDASALGQIRMLEQTQYRRGHRLTFFSNDRLRPALQAANFI